MLNQDKLDRKRITIYLAWAFGLAWMTSLIIYLTGGLRDSPVLLPGTGITLAFVLLALPVMWSPAPGPHPDPLADARGLAGRRPAAPIQARLALLAGGLVPARPALDPRRGRLFSSISSAL